MKYRLFVVVALLLCTPLVAEAGFFRRRSSNASTTVVRQSAAPAGCHTRTAQGVAEIMARVGNVGHWGGNPGYEGCGAGFSQSHAYNNCCFANSGMKTVDVGYAQSASGMWFCCRRYGR